MSAAGLPTPATLVPLIAQSADRPAYWVVGDRYTVLLSAAETGGALSLFEFIVPSGRGSPPHIHHAEDETFFVIDGDVEFTVAGAMQQVGPGGVVFGARGTAHSFRNTGVTDARMMVVCTPGGLERFFAAAGQIAGDPSTPPPEGTPADKARMIQHAPDYGIELLLQSHSTSGATHP